MNFGICLQSMVALRESPSEKSEMTNQLLFGDLFSVDQIHNNWCFIKTIDDGYSAWANVLQLHFLSDDYFDDIKDKTRYYSLNICNIAQSNNKSLKYTLGSILPDFNNSYFKIEDSIFKHEGDILTADAKIDLIEIAKKYLGSPYLWGGRSVFGIDCSGLAQMVFKLKGILLPRDASEQVKIGTTINFIDECCNGDLAFFENDEGTIVHVGIIIGNNKIIHASGEVKIDSIDHNGIFNKELEKYTHKLRIIKRIL